MAATIDASHDPALQSWVESANDAETDFPLQNLPFGRYRAIDRPRDGGHDFNSELTQDLTQDGTNERTQPDVPWRIGVAIGNQVLDLQASGLFDSQDMQRLMALPADRRRALRSALSQGLQMGSVQATAWRSALLPMDQVELGLPCEIGDYTDFYIGIHHATAVGKIFRPDNPLLPNYKWLPIGYHGRASSVMASGQDFVRPWGQIKGPDDAQPRLAPTQRLDFELELGIFIGAGNVLGTPIGIEQAEDHVFGLTLFNDWSARDVQPWEYQPLGPFLAKNFASTVSPWMVTLEALAPFRQPFTRPDGDPQPLPYLDSAANRAAGALDVQLEVWLQTAQARARGSEGECISRSPAAQAAYWTIAQLVTHHTVGGCNLRPGDLLGSGTLSGPLPEQAGSMLELTAAGLQPLVLAQGEERRFVLDGDRVTLRGRCSAPGRRSIGFGSCSATVLPARG